MTSGPNVPRSQRKRRKLEITLSPKALETLERRLAQGWPSRSALIEALILHGVLL